MLEKDYRKHPAISRSQLTDLLQSPLHYWYHHVDPERLHVEKSSPALRFGQAAHAAVLEPERFGEEYVIGPMASRATTAWKNAVKENPGKTVISPDEHHALQCIVNSLARHPKCKKALFSGEGENEQSFFAIDPETGLELKCRADRILSPGWIIDLKTTSDASANAFAKSMVNFNYHIQAAFYLHVVGLATGVKPQGFCFAVVEKEPPYPCQFFKLSDESVAEGYRVVRQLLTKLADLQSNYQPIEPWPSYSEKIEILELPRWAYSRT